MKKRLILLLPLALLGGTALILGPNFNFKNVDSIEKPSAVHASTVYWTCPMHPQVNSPIPGSCPICHMALVKIQSNQENSSTENRSSVHASAYEQDLAHINKAQVQKINIQERLPIAGRFVDGQRLFFQLYEQDHGKIKNGDKILISSTLASGQEFQGKITNIDSFVDPSSRTIRISASLDRSVKNIYPDSSFSGEVQINHDDLLAIPRQAVVHTGKGDLVYKFETENKLVPTKVILGQASDEYYEVKQGLQLGEEVASGATFLIDSESRIRGARDQ